MGRYNPDRNKSKGDNKGRSKNKKGIYKEDLKGHWEPPKSQISDINKKDSKFKPYSFFHNKTFRLLWLFLIFPLYKTISALISGDNLTFIISIFLFISLLLFLVVFSLYLKKSMEQQAMIESLKKDRAN
ncbi:MAG: hypothetical protein ACTSU2_15055 [Promethearchaeota archaeon]